jgi:hypothetical protein
MFFPLLLPLSIHDFCEASNEGSERTSGFSKKNRERSERSARIASKNYICTTVILYVVRCHSEPQAKNLLLYACRILRFAQNDSWFADKLYFFRRPFLYADEKLEKFQATSING